MSTKDKSSYSKHELVKVIENLKLQLNKLTTERNLAFNLSILLFVCFASLSFWLFSTYQTQTIVTQELTDRLVEQAREEERNKPVTVSSDFGYRVTYDPKVWKTGNLTISLTNVDYNNFELSPPGSAKVSVSSSIHPAEYWMNIWRKQYNDTKSSDLDLWMKHYRAQARQDEGKIINTEKITRWGVDSYKVTFESNILGYKAKTYHYLTIVDGWPFAVLASYSEYGNSKDITESFIDSIVFYNPANPNSKVQGASTVNQSPSLLEEVKISDLNKPSTVSILALTCSDLVIKVESLFLQPKYEFCSGGQGSGFILNKDGYIGTNGHVTKVFPEDAILFGLQYGTLSEFAVDLAQQVNYEAGFEMSDADAYSYVLDLLSQPGGLDALIEASFNLISAGYVAVENEKNAYFVKLGNQPFEIDEYKINSQELDQAIKSDPTIFTAKLLDFDYAGIVPVNFDGTEKQKKSDVAIIKLDNPQNVEFPAVTLGDSATLREGSPIVVIGYPGLVSGDSGDQYSLLDYGKSSVKATVTKGIISAIKTDTGGRKLIQTDASIDHGNSGGPAFDYSGNVIGIATYGFQSEGGNYNFLRDIEDLKSIMLKNNITLGDVNPVYVNWNTGLENFWAQKYKNSLTYFTEVKEAYPPHSSVDQFISDATNGISRGEDKSSILSNVPLIPLVIVGVVIALVMVGFVVFLVIRKKSVSTTTPTTAPQTPPPPTPTIINPS